MRNRKIFSILLAIIIMATGSLSAFAAGTQNTIDAASAKEIYSKGEEAAIMGTVKKADGTGFPYARISYVINELQKNKVIGNFEGACDEKGNFEIKINTANVNYGTGDYKVEINASDSNKASIEFKVRDIVNGVALNTDKDEYYRGHTMVISGKVYENNIPKQETRITYGIEQSGKDIIKGESNTNEKGEFKIEYSVGSDLNYGKAKVTVSSFYGKAEKEVEIKSSGGSSSGGGSTGGGSSSGGSSTGGSSTSTDKTETSEKTDEDGNTIITVTVSEKELEKEFKDSNKDKVVIEVKDKENADLTKNQKVEVVVGKESVKFAKENNKEVEIKVGKNKVILPKGFFDEFADEDIKIVIEKVSEKELKEATKDLKQEFKVASRLINIDIFKLKDGKEEKVSFKKSIKIVVEVSTDDVKDTNKLGMYYLNEETNEWEYVGGVFKDGTLEFDINHLSKFTAMEYTKTFSDIASYAWAKNEIETLASRHVVNGMTEKEFVPSETVTRAQFAKMLVAALRVSAGEEAVNFGDVSSDVWYAEPVKVAASLGIVTGRGDGNFDPNGEITRQEMATMVVRALKIASEKNFDTKELNFKDANEIANWAKENVQIAYSAGIINGRTSDEFVPEGKATRAESAVMMFRMLKAIDIVK